MMGAFKQAIAYMKSIYSERLGRTRLEDLTRLIAFIFHIVFIKGRLKAEKSFQTTFSLSASTLLPLFLSKSSTHSLPS